MKLIFEWTEGRETRRSEAEIPLGLTWEETQKHIVSASRKAYKYSNVPLPAGITEGEL